MELTCATFVASIAPSPPVAKTDSANRRASSDVYKRQKEIEELFDRLTRALDKTLDWVTREGLTQA